MKLYSFLSCLFPAHLQQLLTRKQYCEVLLWTSQCCVHHARQGLEEEIVNDKIFHVMAVQSLAPSVEGILFGLKKILTSQREAELQGRD